MAAAPLHSEAFSRGTRMLRTALGPAIAAFLEDPSIVEVMLNPDGRLRPKSSVAIERAATSRI